MKKLIITGYGDDLTVNGTRIGDLSPLEHEQIEQEKGGQNYHPLENVVVSHVKDSSTLICRKPSNDGVANYIEEEIDIFSKCDLLIRKYPFSWDTEQEIGISRIKNYVADLKVNNEEMLQTQIKWCDILIYNTSSCGIIAMLSGRIAINVALHDVFYWNPLEKEGSENAVIHCTSASELKKMINQLKNLNCLIYPLPTKLSLGVHAILNLNGEVFFGPNIYKVDEIDYHTTDKYKDIFKNEISKFIDYKITDLHPDYSGIRPKIKFENDINDFVIKREKHHENFYNLIGIDSPGLTSSLAIAEYLSKIIKN